MKKRTHEECHEAFRHIKYELQMFTQTQKRLQQEFNSDIEKNVWLEAFLLHARNLLDFLFYKKPRNDDVHASQYIASSQSEIPTDIDDPDLRTALNKLLAHVTYKRIELRDYEWNPDYIADLICRGFCCFLASIDSNLVNNSDREGVESYLAHHCRKPQPQHRNISTTSPPDHSFIR